MTDQGEAEVVKHLQKHIDDFRDRFHSMSRMKRSSNDETFNATADLIIKVLDSISMATSDRIVEPCSKTIQRIVYVCKDIIGEDSACRRAILNRCMKFSLVTRNCGSEIWRKEVRAPLRMCYPHNSVLIDYCVTPVRFQQLCDPETSNCPLEILRQYTIPRNEPE